jgi:TonB family protein
VPAPTFPPTPSPVPTAAPPRLEAARLVRSVAPEDVDADRAGVSLPATVVVTVSVDANGRVSGVRTEHSSGSIFLDREALAAARASSYAPAKVDGKPTAGTYRAVYEFR